MTYPTPRTNKTVADFFAGIGLVTMGLERAGWKTVYALDYDKEKEGAYVNHFGPGHYVTQDVAETHGSTVPSVTLVHASFPCTDLSVAGGRGGIHKGESSAFWHFIRIVEEMREAYGDVNPPLILLENVEGLLTSNSGNDLRAVLSKLNGLGYLVDLLRVDAANFVPQSRVRLFIIGIHEHAGLALEADIDYVEKNSDLRWYFHPLPHLPSRQISLTDVLDQETQWWSEERTDYLFNQMHARHKALVEECMKKNEYSYFPAFRRMRTRDGALRSTVELRTDGIAGCLRTPKGGSARQIIVRAGRNSFNARLINGKEAARLMGADDFSIDPTLSLNQVLFGFGDAVCVPAVEWIGRYYLNTLPVLSPSKVSPLHPVLSS
jgi:DNA (cytosine-5)-methyltransferase 1